jgi:quinol monooxygenase YgiN
MVFERFVSIVSPDVEAVPGGFCVERGDYCWHISFRRCYVSVHTFVFEPRSGKETEFREELLGVVEPTRAETGCLSIHVFESLREPFVFAIHSEWVDEAAFELHAKLPHTVRFLQAAEKLLAHPVQGLRTRHIAGGAGAAV